MNHPSLIRRGLAAALVIAVAASARAQAPHEKFTNLKVLPKDISPQELRATMGGFTRALGVRCNYCHVGEEGKPLRFAADDKATKRKARAMIRMVNDLNGNVLAHLEDRSNPPVKVECATCHRGAPLPRTLQDVLQQAYEHGGLDSTFARYHALRDRYYGRATYDFGEVSLAELASRLRDAGHAGDGVRVLAFNVEMNPQSGFAKREYAASAILLQFRDAGVDSGTAAYRALQAQYGPALVNEALLNDVGHALLLQKRDETAMAVFELDTRENPTSSHAFDALGDGYDQRGDHERAIEAFRKALELDPNDEFAKRRLTETQAGPKSKPR